MDLKKIEDTFAVLIGDRGLSRNLPDALWMRQPNVFSYSLSSRFNGHGRCLMAHQEAWKQLLAVRSDAEPDLPYMVVEDDAVFLDNVDWDYIANVIKPYDFVYLGGQWLIDPELRVEPITTISAGYSARSHAYLMTSTAADYLLRKYKWNFVTPWPMQDWVDRLKVGLLYHPIAGQAQNLSSITGMMHEERWWEPTGGFND